MSNNPMVSLISRVGFLHIKFSKYVHWRKSLTENQKSALHETRTQSLGPANIKWHKELYIEKQNHDRYSTPVKNIAKTRKNHVLPHKRIKRCAFTVRLPEKLDMMPFGQRRERWHFVRGNTLNMQKFDSQFQGLESRFGWAELGERTAQLHSGMRRKHIDFTFTTWLRAHLQEERSCCKIENLMLLQSRTVGICFCPIDIQIHCSVTGKQATRHTATVRESLQDIMISDIFCSRTNALSIPFSSFFL